MDGNILLKEHTHKIEITCSRSARALIRQLANTDKCSLLYTGDIDPAAGPITQRLLVRIYWLLFRQP